MKSETSMTMPSAHGCKKSGHPFRVRAVSGSSCISGAVEDVSIIVNVIPFWNKYQGAPNTTTNRHQPNGTIGLSRRGGSGEPRPGGSVWGTIRANDEGRCGVGALV